MASALFICEACVETIEQAITAEKHGADRIEFCADLGQDGLTPAVDDVQELQTLLNIPIKVMIRCRSGNFIYSSDEIAEMLDEIHQFQLIGIRDFVFGALDRKNHIDLAAIQKINQKAGDCRFTFHKAIDLCDDPLAELEKLAPFNCFDSILTSGKKPTAIEGNKLINQMHGRFGKRFSIIAAGKITTENITELRKRLFVNEFHGRLIV
ncbi:MAG: copper homeostasis protein CutC [Calditrichaeota bacterium]|nr:copper homeostasis protein CutC [Calditrichota bacterium]